VRIKRPTTTPTCSSVNHRTILRTALGSIIVFASESTTMSEASVGMTSLRTAALPRCDPKIHDPHPGAASASRDGDGSVATAVGCDDDFQPFAWILEARSAFSIRVADRIFFVVRDDQYGKRMAGVRRAPAAPPCVVRMPRRTPRRRRGTRRRYRPRPSGRPEQHREHENHQRPSRSP
jgi:hypothetical protein